MFFGAQETSRSVAKIQPMSRTMSDDYLHQARGLDLAMNQFVGLRIPDSYHLVQSAIASGNAKGRKFQTVSPHNDLNHFPSLDNRGLLDRLCPKNRSLTNSAG